MKTYKGAEQIWKAFKEGKKLTMNPNHNVTYYKMLSYRSEFGENVYLQRIEEAEYFFANPQMNVFSACLKNGSIVKADLDLWDLHVHTWYDYDELQNETKKDEVKELTIQEIQNKLGYKIKIVEQKE